MKWEVWKIFSKKSDLKFSVLDYLRMSSNAAAGMIYLSEKKLHSS